MDAPIPVAGTAVVLRDRDDGLQTLLLRRRERGSFPGAWVFPGGMVEQTDAGTDEQRRAMAAALRETGEEAGIRVTGPQTLSCWEPPTDAVPRIRTWFFLARDRGDELVLNPDEAVAARWLSPERALAGHLDGTLVLWPPTWVTLHGLQRFGSVDDVYAATGEVARYLTRRASGVDGDLLVWAGDERHPDAPGAAGARHRLATGRLPWVFERS